MELDDYDLIDDYYHGNMNEEEATVFRARMEMDEELAESFSITKGLYDMLNWKEQNKLLSKLERGKYKNRKRKNLDLIKYYLDNKMKIKEIRRFWKLLQKDEVLAKDFAMQQSHPNFKQQVERLEFFEIVEKAQESYCKEHAEELLEIGRECFENRKEQWLWTIINTITGLRLRLKKYNIRPGDFSNET